MAKRFTDSNKFRDTWYRKLKPTHKCLWEYMVSECSQAGILEIDLDSISFHIGTKITIEDIKQFEDRIFFIKEDRIFISKFLMFQQPNGLNPENNAHKGIIKELEENNIPTLYENIKDLISSSLGASEELASSPSKGKGKGKGKGISNSLSNSNNVNFEKIKSWWNNLPYGLAQVQMISDKRKSSIRNRIKEIGSEDEFMIQIEKAIDESDFLRGSTGWKADFDFILQQKSFIKMIEGGYKQQTKEQQHISKMASIELED